ncbi:MAG: hypothetical protein ACP5OG_02925 [Candidatus Nanoarchaeia archaeon]
MANNAQYRISFSSKKLALGQIIEEICLLHGIKEGHDIAINENLEILFYSHNNKGGKLAIGNRDLDIDELDFLAKGFHLKRYQEAKKMKNGTLSIPYILNETSFFESF